MSSASICLGSGDGEPVGEGDADRFRGGGHAYGAAGAGQSQLSLSAVAALNASRSPVLREVMRLPSTTTSASVQSAPALMRSVFVEMKDVGFRPLARAAPARINGACQIASTALSAAYNAV